jgi:peptidoglycan/xylan/chitin deacetylase (PgdA/CDA1 family)
VVLVLWPARALAAVCAALGVLAAGAALGRAARAAGVDARGPGRNDAVIWRVKTSAPEVALTFDDGPDPTYTPQVLDLLAQEHAAATFFVVGARARLYPGVVRQETADGFQVCNHGWSHRMMRGMAPAAVAAEVTRTHELLERLGIPDCDLFRFPYFASDGAARAVVTALGYRIVAANLDTLDWRLRSARTMASRVLRGVQPGDIILMHDAGGHRARTVAALALILAGLRADGIRAVTVGSLLQSAAGS